MGCAVMRSVRFGRASTLIPDEITQAQQGEIKVTAVLLYAVKILRADGFAKVEVQHA